MTTEQPLDFWESLPDKPFGCNAQQVAFARALFEGNTKTEAAKIAGYQCNSEINYRGRGSAAAKSPKVKALLNAARDHKRALASGLVTSEELLRLLSHEARSGENASSRIRAQEVLARYHSLMDRTPETERTTESLLNDLCDRDVTTAEGALLASLALIAADDHIGPEWLLPSDKWQALSNAFPELLRVIEHGRPGIRAAQRKRASNGAGRRNQHRAEAADAGHSGAAEMADAAI